VFYDCGTIQLTIEEIITNAYQKQDKEVLLIKLIDRLHNIQNIESIKSEKQKELAEETLNDIIITTTIWQNLNLETELISRSFTILYGKETANQIINKRYNIFSVFDSYQPPLPTFQNEI